jgi:hypothetical protein
MDREFVITVAERILREKGPMASIVLSYRLREDYGLDVSSNQLAQLIRIFGKEKIKVRNRKGETGFGSYKVPWNAKIYESGLKNERARR